MALLEIENVRKSFGSFVALERISLQVSQGECVALLGPSGCGKSTLLNIVAGFMRPDAGSISFDEVVINKDPPHKRNMGMVFQDYALFPHLNVIENLEFGLRMRNVPARERRGPAIAALDLVGLRGLEERGIKQLSGGQQQRVAVARALVNRPKLLLFDEPLSNLDARLRDTMRSEIRAVLDRTKISAIFVTHDQAEAFAIADRVALLNKGKIVQIGTAKEIYEFPASRFVASFIGGCNLIDGAVTEVTGDKVMARTVLGPVCAASPHGAVWAPHLKVSLVLRYHNIRLDPESALTNAQAGDLTNHTSCQVETIEYLGAISRVVVKHSSGQALTAETTGRSVLRAGDRVVASWNEQDVWSIPDGSET